MGVAHSPPVWIFADGYKQWSCFVTPGQNDKRCFRLTDMATTWADAETNCMRAGAHLASFSTLDDVEQAVHDLKERVFENRNGKSSEVWIGLRFDSDSARYKWFNDRTVNHTYWAIGEPNGLARNEHCVTMYDHGRWNDQKCDAELQGLCAIDGSPPVLPPESAVPSASPSEASLLSPTRPPGYLLTPREVAEARLRRYDYCFMPQEPSAAHEVISSQVNFELMELKKTTSVKSADLRRDLQERFDRIEAASLVVGKRIDALMTRAQLPQPSTTGPGTGDYIVYTTDPPLHAAARVEPSTPVSSRATPPPAEPVPLSDAHTPQTQAETTYERYPPRVARNMDMLFLAVIIMLLLWCKAVSGKFLFCGCSAIFSHDLNSTVTCAPSPSLLRHATAKEGHGGTHSAHLLHAGAGSSARRSAGMRVHVSL